MKPPVLFVAIVGAMCATACSDPVADAKRQLDIVKRNHGTADEVCVAHRKLVKAYLEANDEKNYAFEKMLADGDCLSADIEARLRAM